MSDLDSGLESWTAAPEADVSPAEEPIESTEPETVAEEESLGTSESAPEPSSPDPKPVVEDKQSAAYKQAMLDERAKRQELEIRLARLEGRLDASAKPPEPEEDEDDDSAYWEDPKGYAVRVAEKKAEEKLNAYAQAEWNARVEWSQTRARAAHDDYDAVESAFMELAQKDPSLQAKVRSSYDPAEFVYQHMKTLEAQKSFDPEAERARIKAEILAELKRETSTATKKTSKTLAAEQSASPQDKDVLADEDTLMAKALSFRY